MQVDRECSPVINAVLRELYDSGSSEQLCVADCLTTIAANSEEQASDEHLVGCARLIIEAANRVIEAVNTQVTVTQNSVWLVFGISNKEKPTQVEFATQAEVNAFLMGVEQAAGCLDYTQFDTKEEADAYFYNQEDDDSAKPSDI